MPRRLGASMQRLLVLALLAIAIPTTAQPTEFGFSDDYLARIGEGDIPLTGPVEPAGWNVAEYLRVDHDGNETRIALGGGAGTVLDAYCACGDVTVEGSQLIITGGNATSDIVRLVRALPGDAGTVATFALYGGQAGRIVAYVPTEHSVLTDASLLSTGLTCTTGACTIEEYATGGDYFAIVPGTTTVPMPVEEDGLLSTLGPIVLGILIGIVVWALLVKQGIVQKRRAQEVKVAAHVEAAQTESKDVLQARKRVLMSGLKELEKAKMAKEIDTDVYDQLKAELKKETVTVMRALEAAE